jgi:hypothetical protein
VKTRVNIEEGDVVDREKRSSCEKEQEGREQWGLRIA